MSLADAAADLPLTTAEDLPDDAATLKRMVLELLASLHERDRDIEGYRHRINLLLRRLNGPHGERMNPDQLLLFPEPGHGPSAARAGLGVEAQAAVPAARPPAPAGEPAPPATPPRVVRG